MYFIEVARTVYSSSVSPACFSINKDSRPFGTLGGPRRKNDVVVSSDKDVASVETLAADVAPGTSAEADRELVPGGAWMEDAELLEEVPAAE